MSNHAFRSRARNGEDIVIWRALGNVTDGRYVDAGSAGPVTGSVTAALADQGWKGIEIPAEQVLSRPLDAVLAELGGPVHVLALDAGGQQSAALATLDLAKTRPHVLLVRTDPPDPAAPREPAWEAALLDAGYRRRLFTGLFVIYVAAEHDDRLGAALSYPACVLDDADRPADEERLARAERDLIRWRALALDRWDEGANGSTLTSVGWEVVMLRKELTAIRETVSWRLTRPIRVARRVLPRESLKRAAAVLRGGR